MKTNVALILDSSGSMLSLLPETISGFNDYLQTLKDTDHEIGVTFTVFASKAEVRFVDRPISEVAELSNETYRPIGFTALYDAVGQTIQCLEDEVAANPEDAFLVMIFSDGQENNSKEYKSSTLANVIQRLQETGKWTFTYMGSNQDLAEVAETLKIPVGNLCNYEATSDGTKKAFNKLRDDTSKYFVARSFGACASTSLYGDKIEIAHANDDS